jgi:crotonobetainyl-CoA:carnitine CoA-transferase CaiB-like acyl-CoA transferase
MLALDGVRVLDLGQYLAGPFGPMVLGDLGADVIKLEPVTGDGMRLSPKPFFGCQRGKRSVALNVKAPAGHDVALRLVATTDVVHHNMTKGVATRLGLDYEACRAVRPDVVYCNTYAYGREGPLSHFGGLDPLYQAATGQEYEAGAAETGNTPLYYRYGMCDTGNAMLSVVGVLAALYHRARTGEGQELWTSLLDAGAVFSSDAHLVGGEPWDRPRLDAGLHGLSACYRLYRTQDDDWIQLAVVTDEQFRALCEAAGRPELADDARFATAADRHRCSDELAAELEEVFAGRTAGHWHRFLDAAGVPNEVPVDNDDGLVTFWDADQVDLGLVARYPHPLMGAMRQFGELISFSETPGEISGPPPLVGQHTREVLHEIGCTDAEVDDLIAQGVAYEPDEGYAERFAC